MKKLLFVLLCIFIVGCTSDVPPVPDAPGVGGQYYRAIGDWATEPRSFEVSPDRITCQSGEDVELNMYVSDEDFVYTDMFIWDNSQEAWSAISLQGNSVTDEWIGGYASIYDTESCDSLQEFADENNELFFVAYACSRDGSSWDCSDNKWQLQIVEVLSAVGSDNLTLTLGEPKRIISEYGEPVTITLTSMSDVDFSVELETDYMITRYSDLLYDRSHYLDRFEYVGIDTSNPNSNQKSVTLQKADLPVFTGLNDSIILTSYVDAPVLVDEYAYSVELAGWSSTGSSISEIYLRTDMHHPSNQFQQGDIAYVGGLTLIIDNIENIYTERIWKDSDDYYYETIEPYVTATVINAEEFVLPDVPQLPPGSTEDDDSVETFTLQEDTEILLYSDDMNYTVTSWLSSNIMSEELFIILSVNDGVFYVSEDNINQSYQFDDNLEFFVNDIFLINNSGLDYSIQVTAQNMNGSPLMVTQAPPSSSSGGSGGSSTGRSQ